MDDKDVTQIHVDQIVRHGRLVEQRKGSRQG